MQKAWFDSPLLIWWNVVENGFIVTMEKRNRNGKALVQSRAGQCCNCKFLVCTKVAQRKRTINFNQCCQQCAETRAVFSMRLLVVAKCLAVSETFFAIFETK